jgi:excinuclease ABC subunit C
MTKSALDDIPGLGPGRRKRLLKEFGSVKKIRALTEEELLAVPWLPDTVGRRVYDRLHSPSPPARSPTPVTVSSWRGDE